MKAASAPRAAPGQERLLVVDPQSGSFRDFSIGDLPEFFGPGDALVLNDAATLPASLRVGKDLELRLMSRFDDGTWLAIASVALALGRAKCVCRAALGGGAAVCRQAAEFRDLVSHRSAWRDRESRDSRGGLVLDG
jgi:S-adenosylmethionine:tRNA-ribosyltransferase-isomerase (queuine synthetase)